MNRRRPNRSRPKPDRTTPARARSKPRPPTDAVAERLQKLLAAAGLGSRRTIETWIAAGRVTVNGTIATLGERARWRDRICVDGRLIEAPAERDQFRVLLYHKPVGELVTHHDPAGRRTVFSALPRCRTGKWLSVGRLDINSSGLLLFTDSGALVERLTHPRYGYEREYLVRVRGEFSEAARRRLLAGVDLEDGPAAFKSVIRLRDDPVSAANSWLRVVLGEGRNREVRRMLEAVGLQVSRLVRVRFGPFQLPRGLRPGQFSELEPAILAQLLEGTASEPHGDLVTTVKRG